MSGLEKSQLRTIVKTMRRAELEDLMCMLCLINKEAMGFVEATLHTEDFLTRMRSDCLARLEQLFSHTDRSGVLESAKRCVRAFAQMILDEDQVLGLMLSCLESAVCWAINTGSPEAFCDELMDMFEAFVARLNRQENDELYQSLHERIVRLELDADMLGGQFGETFSELCLDIRWWGSAQG